MKINKSDGMSEALITPSIITWARERSYLTLENLAEMLKTKSDNLMMWENGEKKPFYFSVLNFSLPPIKYNPPIDN